MKEHVWIGVAIAGLVSLAGSAWADPPLNPPKDTSCPTVQCMRVNQVIDNLDGTFDVEFETFNWFDTDDDGGVHTVLFFPTRFLAKTGPAAACDIDNDGIQASVEGAVPPPGWTLVHADDLRVEFQANASLNAIPDMDLCHPDVVGGCINGGGLGISTCGNEQGGFVIRLRPEQSVPGLCTWVANWRHLDENGLDNGDVMNFGSVSWTFGSIIEDYSNTPMEPFYFRQSGVVECAKSVQKRAAKYASTRLKAHGKCINAVNAGKSCDTAKRDLKVGKAQAKMDAAIDGSCSDDNVANVAWCGTTRANLKTCLAAQIQANTDGVITSIYGPQ